MATVLETPQGVTSAPAVKPAAVERNVAVDVYRGLVMLLMMAEVLEFSRVSIAFPTSIFWKVLAWNQTHSEWFGCSLHDTIQPGFSFLVGVALPYSIASRIAKGGSFWKLFAHALWRSLVLVALGVFLRSMDHSQTYFTFEDTLSQIGFGYPFLFLLGFRPPKWAWAALGVILVGYWAAWALYPLPPAGFDWQSVGVSTAWSAQHNFTGFAAHWNKNWNFGNRFDQWFLNLFPREHPFVYNDGGYLTLSFIPTLGTMILGLVAGRWLREAKPKIPMKKLLAAGVAGIVIGLALHYTGICPVVKRIWTPSWTIFSGGICFFFLAGLSWVIDIKKYRRWAFPLVVIGMNSITAYCIAHFLYGFLTSTFRIHLGPTFFDMFGTGLQPFVEGSVVLFCYWLVLFWMYRKKLFVKI
jgi:heparan-alpha-glucosaminide N-acetyltransferase